MRILVSTLLALSALGQSATSTFTGTISDSMCAADHSGMRMGPTDPECTLACVEEHDAQLVLVDGTNVYSLSDQKGAAKFAGKKVVVRGTLDVKTRTIRVASIAAAK
jgi:hypothetical protein